MDRSVVSAARFNGWLHVLGMLVLFALALGGIQCFVPDDRPFPAAFARGALIVAVPSRPAPTLTVGKVDRSVRSPDAFAVALADDLAHRVGLPVRVVLAEPHEARVAVESGRADLAIAGLAYAPDASIAFAPTSYASGRGVALVLRHGNIQRMGDLAGRAICASHGSGFAASVGQRYRVQVQDYDRPLDALLAFQAGECAALVDDELVVRALMKQPDWAYYRVLPGAIAPAPAFIASKGGDIASAAFVERTISDWRRERWLRTVREDQATRLAFEMFNAQNDLYCH